MIVIERLNSAADKQQQLVGASDETVVCSNVTPCNDVFISYLLEFDGTDRKDFENDVGYLFDSIYHDDYTDVIMGKLVTKEQLRKIHGNHFSHGSIASIIQCEKGLASVLVTYRLSNDKNDMFIQSSITIEGNKFIRARTLDDSFGKFLGQADNRGRRKQ